MNKESALRILRSACNMAVDDLDVGENAQVLGYLAIMECHVPTEGRRLIFIGGDLDDNPLPAYTVAHYLDVCLAYTEEAVERAGMGGGED